MMSWDRSYDHLRPRIFKTSDLWFVAAEDGFMYAPAPTFKLICGTASFEWRMALVRHGYAQKALHDINLRARA